jgi:hypothetical protein
VPAEDRAGKKTTERAGRYVTIKPRYVALIIGVLLVAVIALALRRLT